MIEMRVGNDAGLDRRMRKQCNRSERKGKRKGTEEEMGEEEEKKGNYKRRSGESTTGFAGKAPSFPVRLSGVFSW